VKVSRRNGLFNIGGGGSRTGKKKPEKDLILKADGCKRDQGWVSLGERSIINHHSKNKKKKGRKSEKIE